MTDVKELATRAKAASRKLGRVDRATKDRALLATARLLRDEAGRIAEANAKDMERARASGLAGALVDRLEMNAKGIAATAAGVEYVASLADPVGSRDSMQRLQNGLLIGRQRLPLGVIAMIYEARPNVTIDAAVLCLKAGNAVLLRGGKEAAETNRVLGELLRQALTEAGLPEDAVGIVAPTDREGIKEMVSLTGLIDLAIPRGGEGLIRFVAENARVPVLNHYKGVCHLFLDEGCNPKMAQDLTINGKVSRPGVCNALECLLVHENVARSILPDLGRALLERGVQIRGDSRTCELVTGAVRATDDDWGTEFLDLVLAVKVVRDIDGAIEHIERYGSNHTEAICTESHTRAQRWLREVDASCVIVNASTRFNDGGQLGLGAEIGISTSKLHAYGPMGLEGLTAEKWVVLGDGQIRN
ncbi:MAG TPA: glutamate-5-semialdehyde dehydrogenase [Polyangiaceae bacterium]|nr:glutamate-5-semialdehyde dehydrogenase [Polyangiaceae bacterium]